MCVLLCRGNNVHLSFTSTGLTPIYWPLHLICCPPSSRALITHRATGFARRTPRCTNWHALFHQITIHLFTALRRLTQQKCIFSFSPQRSRKYLLLSIKRASIKRWCEEKGQSIVWRIYSICIRNCVQFTNSLFYNLVHLTAAGGQIMVRL